MATDSLRRRGTFLVTASAAIAMGVGAIGPAAADQPRPDQSVRLAKTDAGPDGIAVDPFGNVYTANSGQHGDQDQPGGQGDDGGNDR